MAQKEKIKTNPDLRIAKQTEEVREREKKKRRRRHLQHAVTLGMLALAVGGTFLVWEFKSYSRAENVKNYVYESTDNNEYAQFGNGVVGYNSDGVVYMNTSGTELWNQACQMQNPMMKESDESFVIADRGGSSIFVFTKDGLKGEMSTTMPIEDVTVSNQGIVGVLLEEAGTPKIICYDAVGNILVEHSVAANSSGYPISLSLSKDGKLLLVSYLSTKDGNLSSRVVYYNFDSVGQDETDNVVTDNSYEDEVIPTSFFMDEDTSVAVGDSSCIIYTGVQIPEVSAEIKLDARIKSTFHTNKYIGFVLNKEGTTDYELRIYSKSGRVVLSRTLEGGYDHVKMIDDEVFLYDGTKCCIMTMSGVQRFRGDVSLDVRDIMPLMGINRYLVISSREMKSIHLAK